jgi:hypothetical protein
LLLRDAVVQLARVLFDSDDPIPVVLRWDPAIAPIVLDIAARFGGGTGRLVWAFVSPMVMRDHHALLPLADWRRGKLVKVPSTHPSVPHAVSRAMGSVSLRAAIFVGGTDDVETDADELAPGVQRFAVASTGGTARALILAPRGLYTGGNALSTAELNTSSYLELFKKVTSII